MKKKSGLQQFYDYQEHDISAIFSELESGTHSRIVYQLPTGGGKTVVFSEIARRYIEARQGNAMILTHRKELVKQTSATLSNLGVPNKTVGKGKLIIESEGQCFIAMVETLRNRIKEKKVDVSAIGLLIIDEAHHNAFRKLFRHFANAFVIGVTATPFSSDISKPMNRYYQSIILGEDISSLINRGFLAKPQTFTREVELNSLKTGIHGDYTVSSSNELYGTPAMLQLLYESWSEHARGTKTLIFNNGIEASLKVQEKFENEGIAIRHLDNRTSPADRKEILKWFRKTKDAVLTSVSILTTGFDEPSVKTIVLNRATTSITLYQQMIGRGSRRLKSKQDFNIIDLGNNVQRFGAWEEPVDWKYVFDKPGEFARQIHYQNSADGGTAGHAISAELKSKFPNTLELTFDMQLHVQEAIDLDRKPRYAIQQSIRQQAAMCIDNADSISEALSLADALQPEIQWRVKEYVRCLNKVTKSYADWLLEDYQDRLQTMIRKVYQRVKAA